MSAQAAPPASRITLRPVSFLADAPSVCRPPEYMTGWGGLQTLIHEVRP